MTNQYEGPEDPVETNEDEFIDQYGEIESEYADETENDDSGRNFDQVGQETQQEEIRRWKLKDGDNEEEVDENELLKRAQKASAADRRFQEAANARKQAEGAMAQLREALMAGKQNPAYLLQQLGIDPVKWAETHLSGHIENVRMTPEQRQQRQEQQELQQYREAVRQQQEQQVSHQEEEVRRANVNEIQTGLLNALGAAGLAAGDDPERSVSLALDAAKYLIHDRRAALAEGREPKVTYEDAVRRAMGTYRRTLSQLVESLDADQLYEFLGEVGKQKFRTADMKRHKTNVPSNRPTQTARAPQEQNKPKFVDEKTWAQNIRKRT